MAEPPSPLPDELAAELHTLADALSKRPDETDVVARFRWLVDTLITRGQIPASFRRLIDKARGDDLRHERSPARLAVHDDKYAVRNSDVDCEARYPLCKARCCSLEIPLARQDVEEGLLPFDIERPYMLPKDPETKMCVCYGEKGCTVYSIRPGTCREYSCKEDKRIWIDFEARIPAP